MSEQNINVCLAQLNLLVGDISGNTQQVLKASEEALSQGSDVILFPELTLTGYPPEDLLLRPSLEVRVFQAIETLTKAALPIYIVVGYPKLVKGKLYNMAGVFFKGLCLVEY